MSERVRESGSRGGIMESPREKQLPRGHPAAASLRAIQAVKRLAVSPLHTPTEREPPPPKLLQLLLKWFGFLNFTVRFTAATGQKEMI